MNAFKLTLLCLLSGLCLLLEEVGPELRQRLLARGPAIEEFTHQRRGTGRSMNGKV
jgi:hypothetical protein